ncbi:MAG: Zeta toxin family protein [Magnetococcales bacterium]|nr:zeta toxin family protein [Magnetococcales bacterium]NGZ25937.1 Zeta toxin family protein [Magnetococcales bacterium]
MGVPRKILILAGPNGAGKTTFAQEYLPKEIHCLHFINADLIAAGLSPFAPEYAAIQAGRLMLEQINSLTRQRIDFAFETTLSGRSYGFHIPKWQAMGYHVKLIFLSLPDVELAIQRVKLRVSMGGHSVPEGIIRRRYSKGWHNFYSFYRPLVNQWALYDTSGLVPVLLKEENYHD